MISPTSASNKQNIQGCPVSISSDQKGQLDYKIPLSLASNLEARFVPISYDPKGSKTPIGENWERSENLKIWSEISRILPASQSLIRLIDGSWGFDVEALPKTSVIFYVNKKQHVASKKKNPNNPTKIVPLQPQKRESLYGGIGLVFGKDNDRLIGIDHDYGDASLILEKWRTEQIDTDPAFGEEQILPDTLRFTSGKPGCHLSVYRVPERYTDKINSKVFYVKNEIENYNKKFVGSDGREHDSQLDFRWTNRQSVIFGKHPETGGFYNCINPDQEIADLPDWVCKKLKKEEPNREEILKKLDSLTSDELDRDLNNLYLVLSAYTAEELDWYEWRDVLFACHHHTRLIGDTNLGRETALDWSEQSKKHTIDGFNSVWSCIKGNHPNPITAAAICYRLRQRKGYDQFFKSDKKKEADFLVTKKSEWQSKKDSTIFDRFESIRFDGEDFLTDETCLKDLKVWDLVRSEEGAKDVYKYKINQSAIFDLFLKYYPNRFIKIKLAETYVFYFYEKYNDPNSPNSNAYYWVQWGKETFHSRLWRFAKALLKQIKEQIKQGEWDQMTHACNGYFTALLSQDLCTLPYLSKPQEDTRYRPYLNGLFDLNTKTLQPYTPKVFNISVIPFEYKVLNDSKTFDTYRAYIKSSLQKYPPNLQDSFADFLIEVLFLTLIGKASCLKMFLWLVAPSNSGKTSCVDLLRRLIDPSAVVSVAESDPSYQFPDIQRSSVQQPLLFLDPANRFKNQVFENSYLITCDDEKSLNSKHMGELKRIVSVDSRMSVEKKNINGTYTVDVRSLIIFTGENDPSVSFTDRGGINRLVLWDYTPDLDCFNKFSDLLADYSNRQELDSYLMTNFSFLDLAKKYRELPDFVKQRQQQFREDYDPFTQFFKICCEYGGDYYVQASILYSVFQRFDENCTKYKKTETTIGKQIKGYLDRLDSCDVQVKRTTKDKQTGIYYLGLRLKPWEDLEEHLHFFDDYGGDKQALKQKIELSFSN